MAMKMKKEKVEIAPLIIAVCAFCLLRPFFLWGMSNSVRFGFFPVMYLLAIVPNMDLKQGFKVMFLLFTTLILYVTLLGGYSIAYDIALLSLAVVPFIKNSVFDRAINYFELLLAFFFLGGLLFFIARIVGISLPGQIIAPLNEAKMYNYTLYAPFLVMPN